jgi:hypothetical protein
MLRAWVIAAMVGLAGPALADDPDSTATEKPRRPRPTSMAPT